MVEWLGSSSVSQLIGQLASSWLTSSCNDSLGRCREGSRGQACTASSWLTRAKRNLSSMQSPSRPSALPRSSLGLEGIVEGHRPACWPAKSAPRSLEVTLALALSALSSSSRTSGLSVDG